MLRPLVWRGNQVNRLLIYSSKELLFRSDLSIMNRRMRFLLVELANSDRVRRVASRFPPEPWSVARSARSTMALGADSQGGVHAPETVGGHCCWP